MPHLASLNLSVNSPKQPVSALARKRQNLLRKLDVQLKAADAQSRGEEYLEEIRKTVRGDDGERTQTTIKRPVRKWWWQHPTGAWFVTLRDGAKELHVADGKPSIEVGDIADLVETLQTIRSAVLAGELDKALEALVKKKPAGKAKK